MVFRAFISCRFPVDEDIRAISQMLGGEFTPYISEEPKIGNLAHSIREKIRQADCLVAIAKNASSSFMQNEIAMAYGMGKPVVAIYHEEVVVDGILPSLCTWVSFKDLRDCSEKIPHLKRVLIDKLNSDFLLSGGPEELFTSFSKLGILGVYPSRGNALNDFFRFWKTAKEIVIVGSTLEGFRKGFGIDPRELLGEKLQGSSDVRIRILLTHPDFIAFREKQERAEISKELEHCRKELAAIKDQAKAGDRLMWRFFRGAPTCFMIAADDFMVLNPYLYMQSAIFNFSLILKNTDSELDIYKRYKKYHFEHAWTHSELTSEESELPDSGGK
jgi:hypothetical protein